MIQNLSIISSSLKLKNKGRLKRMAECAAQVQICLDGFLGTKFKRIKKRDVVVINSSVLEGKRIDEYHFAHFPIIQTILNPRCPSCGSRRITPFESRYRNVKRFLGIIEEVELKRYRCQKCSQIFSAIYKDAPPHSLYHYEVIWAAVDLSTRLTESLRHTEVFLNDHLKTDISFNNIHHWVQKSGQCLEKVRTKLVVPFSGYLGIDELHLKLHGYKIYVLGYSDAKTHAFLDFDIVSGKDAKSYSESITRFLTTHQLSSELKAVITDEFSTFISIIPKLFPNCPHQRCIFHAKGNINKIIYATANVSFKKALPKEYRDLKEIINEIFDASTQKHSKYWLYTARSVQIKHGLESNKPITKLLRNLEKKLESLTQFIKDPDCPKTNNAMEQIWSLIRPRKEIMKSFQSEKSIRNYFNILQTIINFKIFKTWCQTHPKEAKTLPFKLNVEYWYQYIKFPPIRSRTKKKAKNQKKNHGSEWFLNPKAK